MNLIHWKQKGQRKVVAEGYGKRLEKKTFINPNDRKEIDFFFFETRPWVVVLPITYDRRVVLVRQYNPATESITEEIPAGKVEIPEELPRDAAQRELYEETGYNPTRIIPLGEGRLNLRHSTTPFYGFLATGCERVGNPQKEDNGEVLGAHERSLEEYFDLFMSGKTMQNDAALILLRSMPFLKLKISF